MVTAAAWEAFQTGVEPVGVRADVLASWRRSRWSGVDPLAADIPHVEVPDDSPYIRTAAPVLQGMTDLLAESRTCLALTDAHGDILWRWVSDGALAADLDRYNFRNGASLNEARVGTNGIGTSLESGRFAVVLGVDHFAQSLHPWSCAAAPVRHPITGRVVGAVNITCRAGDANHFMRVAVRSLADGVRSALRAEAGAGDRALLDAFVAERERTVAPVVSLNADTMIADASASGLGLDHATVWETVAAAGPDAASVALGDGITADLRPVDPGHADAGVVLTLRAESPERAGPVRAPDAGPGAVVGRRLTPLEHAEAAVIVAALADCAGNKSAAAARLGISRGTLYQKLRHYRPLL